MGITKYLTFFTGIFIITQLQAQYIPRTQKSPAVVSATGGKATVGNLYFEWTIGESVMFTGSDGNYFATQGFNQPMICKAIPVITALNQNSCVLPYTLKITSGFDIYRWRVGQVIVASTIDSLYYPIKNGSYMAWVGDSTGCYLPTSFIGVDLSPKNTIPSVSARGPAGQDTLLESTPGLQYQWFVITPSDNVHRAIVAATNQTFRPYYNGTYYVRVNSGDECVSFSSYYTVNNPNMEDISRYIFDQSDTTIDLRKLMFSGGSKLAVYPVPARDKLYIDYYSSEKNTVAINFYNVAGAKVDVKYVKNSSGKFLYEFDSRSLPSGRYVLELIDGEKQLIKNLVFE